MTKTVIPGERAGRVRIPASKSMVHRALIAAAFCGRRVRVRYEGGDSADIAATKACLDAVARARREAAYPRPVVLPCGESGTTLRFFLPIVGALGLDAVFRRAGRLPERPLAPFDAQLRAHGMTIDDHPAGEAFLPGDLHVSGRLRGGVFRLPGNVSSQFFSGLLFAFPLMDEAASFEVIGPLESAAYLEMTRAVLEAFGRPDAPDTVDVEGDWSNAAFFLAMGVETDGLDADSLQGDRAVTGFLEAIREAGRRQGAAVIDVAQTPDLVPVLAAFAATVEGAETRIVNAARLRLKESDRLASTAAMLTALGADVRETADGMTVCGKRLLTGGRTSAYGDHRLAMAAAVAATRCAAPVAIEGAESVAKSYPRFWEDFESLERKE